MRITDIHVDGFGAWSNLDLERLPDQATVFYGPNEAGKSTLLQFIRSVLYGLTPDRRQRYLPPAKGGQPGGRLAIRSPHGEFVLTRRWSPLEPENQAGVFALLGADGAPSDPARLSQLLSGVDEQAYANVFAIGLREIQELSTLHESAAAEHLYKLASGLDRVSLADVMSDLSGSRERLWAGEKASQLLALRDRKQRLTTEIEELAARQWKWTELAQQRILLAGEATKLEETLAAWAREQDVLQLAQQVQPLWIQRQQFDRQISVWSTQPRAPENATEKLAEINARLAKARRRCKGWLHRRKKLRAEAQTLPINRPLLAQEGRVAALREHSQWITSLEAQVQRLTEEVRKLDKEIEAQAAQLGLPAPARGSADEQSQRVINTLRIPLKALKSAEERLEQAKHECEITRRESEQAISSAAASPSARWGMDLTAALQEAGQRVANLRRRIQIEERLEQLTRSRDELEEDTDYWQERQLLPPRLTALLGIAFALGVMFILSGAVGGMLAWVTSGMPLILTGIVLIGGAIFFKVNIEHNAQGEFEECRSQLLAVRRESAQVKEERDQLDSQLPPGGGPLDVRLRSAEADLRELERVAPLQSHRDSATQRNEAAQRRLTETGDALAEARQKWRAALKSVGLPEDFDPARLRLLSQQTDELLELRRRRETRRDELDQRERDLLSLAGRVEQVFQDLGLKPESPRPQAQLEQLTALVAREQEVVARRRELAERLKQAGKKQEAAVAFWQKLQRFRKAFLTRAGVSSEEELQRAVIEQARRRDVMLQRDQLSSQIATTLAGRAPEDEVTQRLAAEGDRLPTRLLQLQRQLEQARGRLAQIHEQRGAIGQEMQALLQDRRLAEAQLELGQVEEQFAAAAHQWRVLSVVERVLEELRREYELKKQPRVLQEASAYLDRLTAGAYQAIRTPLGRRELRITDGQGNTLPLEVLSRGTREAVFLSLRLALADDYARRGVILPLVLDDILVNFDAGRAQAAAAVLRDFAQTRRQVLFFTCHEHILRLFQGAGWETRLLPDRTGRRAPPPPEPEKPKKPKREPIVARVDPPAPATPAPKKRIVVEPPPPPVPRIDPNALFARAAAEEQWYDPVGLLPPPEPVLVAAAAPAPVLVLEPPPPPKPEPRQPILKIRRERRRRFTWESPEMYWEEE